jgi:hypothetical protein
MKRLVTIAAITLAGCGGNQVSLKNATAEEVAAATAKSGTTVSMRPGQWEITTDSVSVDMPGVPPEAKAMTEKMFGKGMVVSECRTESDSKPKPEFFTGKSGGNCTFEKYEMSGTSIDAVIHCDSSGQKMTQKVKGSFGAEAFTVDTEMTGAGPGGQMTIKAKINGKRTGECTAEKKAS